MLSLYIDDYLRAKRRAQPYGMQVILGMEIRFTENSNNYLVYGIEVFNMHIGHNSRVARAAEYANEHPDFLVSGGTDFHHGYQTTPCFMWSKTLPKTSFDVANILKSQDALFDIGGNIVLPNPRKCKQK